MSTNVLPRLIATAVLLSISAFAVDGVVLINQNTVMAAGGFPYRITQSGSYRLTGNLVVTSANLRDALADGAIEISADNVSLDLNGFTISGPGTCTGSPQACTNSLVPAGISSFNNDISIFNGSVRGMGAGISTTGRARVEDVNVTQNSANGIVVGNGIVRHCTMTQNGRDGIDSFGGVVESNLVLSNFNVGIVSFSGTVSGNTANGNFKDGIDAFLGTVSGNSAVENGGFGVLTDSAVVNVNTLIGNVRGDLSLDPGSQSLSNHNNNCSGSVC